MTFNKSFSWGFFAHKQINRLAVFTMPPELITFYKKHIEYITQKAISPDERRYAVENEAPRHYIDIDDYGDSALTKLPRYWKPAVDKYTETFLNEHGTNPWFVQLMKTQLTIAFQERNTRKILRLSAEIGHYIADGNVPLHTTSNYNGQATNQVGIHGFWESRLPELFSDQYDFFVGRAAYIKNTQLYAWSGIEKANHALDSVLKFENELTLKMDNDQKYGYEERNGQTVRVYSKKFSSEYHKMLDGQVESRMKASIKMVGDFWYTCWIDGGQPDMKELMKFEFSDDDKKEDEIEKSNWIKELFRVRPEALWLPAEDMHHQLYFGCCENHKAHR